MADVRFVPYLLTTVQRSSHWDPKGFVVARVGLLPELRTHVFIEVESTKKKQDEAAKILQLPKEPPTKIIAEPLVRYVE